MLLFALTSATDFVGLCSALWLAGYVFSRGYRSPTTLRTVLVLLLLSITFSEGYISLYEPQHSQYNWYLGAYVLAVIVWYNLTYQWLPRPLQRRLRWTSWGIYGVGLLTFIVALLPFSGLSATGPGLYIGAGLPTLFGLGNALMLLPAAIATLVNFGLGTRYGRGPGFRSMWLAAFFGALAMTYGAVSYLFGIYAPRLGLDWLVIAAMLMLGLAVARNQAFVERRTTLQDLPISAMGIVATAAFYAFVTQRAGFSAVNIALVTAIAVFIHSINDLGRELADRLVHRQESRLRHQLRKLARDVGGSETLAANLQTALNNLVTLVRATGGFVAVRRGEHYEVVASVRSLALGERLGLAALAADELRSGDDDAGKADADTAGADKAGARVASAVETAGAETMAWIAPAWANNQQLGAIVLGPRALAGAYSEADMDLLADSGDSLGQLLMVEAQQARGREELMTLATDMEKREVGLQAGAQDLIASVETHLDLNFERAVEQCLQHLSDYTYLGQSGLGAELLIRGATHIERGKALRDTLLQAIDSLRPAGAPPAGILPREWHAYTILHDAYVDDVHNRDIMSKLYVSDGTFHRQRRKALHAVARALLEAQQPAPVTKLEEVTA